MKQFTFFFALIVSALFCGFTVDGGAPPPACFYKKSKCCFKYSSCGYETKKVEAKSDCPYNKCENECKKECYPDRRCTTVKVATGEYCEKKPYGYTFKEVCTPKYEEKEFCYNVQKCGQKCYPKCYSVGAYCVKTVEYNYAKYCPQKYCEDYVQGNDTVPAAYVDSEGTLENETPAKRYDA